MSAGRLALVVVLLIVARATVGTGAPPPDIRDDTLAALPYAIGAWQGVEAPPPDPETRRILAADAVLTRTYADADDAPIGLYIAYYARPRPGVSVHSPLHCLPGTGWEPLEVSTIRLAADGAGGTVRRMIVRKQRERALVLYWYAVHGRTTASEITSKLTLLTGSIRLQRRDAALVRIVTPFDGRPGAADRKAAAFAQALLPYVKHLGS